MPHSAQIREFHLTDEGVQLTDVYVGPEGILIGSARSAQEVRDRVEAKRRLAQEEIRKQEHENRLAILKSQMTVLQAELEAEEHQFYIIEAEETEQHHQSTEERENMAKIRQGGNSSTPVGAKQ